MNPNQDNTACVEVPQAPRGQLIGGMGMKEEQMNLRTHKRLTDLAYRVKDFIDGNGGLTYQEACIFGNIMQGIINLK